MMVRWDEVCLADHTWNTTVMTSSILRYIMSILAFAASSLGWGQFTPVPPDMTHVSQVNAAGQATFNWNPYVPIGTEVWENNRFQVYDLDLNLLSMNPHVIQDANSWATPAFLYDATEMALCVTGTLYTVDNGEQAQSDVASDLLCSIHLSLSEGPVPETVLLEWNSPYALTGAAAGGDFEIERLDDVTATWTLLASVPDSPDGGSYTDTPGACAPTLIYRIRQVASNGVDAHVSNEPGLEFGSTAGNIPTITHVDVNNGLAHVFWEFEPEPENLGYKIFKCTPNGSAEAATIFDNTVFDHVIPASDAGEDIERYEVAAMRCYNPDGTPSWDAPSECVSTILMRIQQQECSSLADLIWNEPTGMEGGVTGYTVQEWDAETATWNDFQTLDGATTSWTIEGDETNTDTLVYRVIAAGANGFEAISSVDSLTFEYPSELEDPVMRYASVLDESTVKLALATDETAEESTVYEFQRWDDVDSLWIPLPIESNEEDSENVTHVDVNLNTNRQTYTYRAVVFNACGDIINRSEEATTMLLQGFSHPEPQTFENNLLWTAYDGFEQGLDHYEVVRTSALHAQNSGSVIANTDALQKSHTDDVEQLFESNGLFCYQVLAIGNPLDNAVDTAKSNRLCLTQEPLVWIPTAFSPNGDDLNEWFPWPAGDAQVGFLGESRDGIPNFKLNIYSRWGENIFTSTSIDDPWDGRINGRLVPSGLYAVHVRYLDGAGGWHEQRVALTVLPGE